MSASLVHTTYHTPFGPLEVFATANDGVVRSSGFAHLSSIAANLPTALHAQGWVEGEIPAISQAVQAWLAGAAAAITAVPVEQPGAAFAQDVWAALRETRAGTVSYGELAELVGRPRAARAVGTACGANAIAPFVPCHRVIQAGGKLGKYGYGGTAIKAALLAHEGEAVTAS
jgi:methylated-DNA-[protein]-cysteine S-methyltransferase